MSNSWNLTYRIKKVVNANNVHKVVNVASNGNITWTTLTWAKKGMILPSSPSFLLFSESVWWIICHVGGRGNMGQPFRDQPRRKKGDWGEAYKEHTGRPARNNEQSRTSLFSRLVLVWSGVFVVVELYANIIQAGKIVDCAFCIDT